MAHDEGTPTPAAPQHGLSPEQLEIRRTRLGASEIAAALGLDPYTTPYELWAKKQWPDLGTPDAIGPARTGHLLEPVVARMYEMHRLAQGETVATVRHQETLLVDDWACATPDYLAIPAAEFVPAGDGLYRAEMPDYDRAVELKTKRNRWLATKDGWGTADEGMVPYGVLVQVQVQLVALDLPFCDVVMYPRDEDDVQVSRVERDRDLAAQIFQAGREWWARHVVGGEAPAIQAGPLVDDILLRLFPHAGDKKDILTADENAAGLLAHLGRVKADIEELEAMESHLTTRLKELVGNAYGIEGPAGRFIWSDRKGNPKYKELAEHLGATPALIEQFRGPTIRVGRFTPREG